ncbi:PP2C family protein-serine/threonine phosphatase [Streptomyces sp. NPDC003077]|uniref:PP2C family protein-serine/threonine phosphatase n=1 Tax=Streptomyces sp. NPDC003077 TaxID=3154443 RepID=UPI0033A41912
MPVPGPQQRTAVLSHQTRPVDDDTCGGADEGARMSAQEAVPEGPRPPAAQDDPERPPGPAAPGPQGLTLLLIGEDPTSLVPEIRDEDGRRVRVRTARNLTEAERLLTPDVHCVLLDLAPLEREAPGPEDEAGPIRSTEPATASPNGATEPPGPGRHDGLDTLRALLRLAPEHPVLALTTGKDAERAAAAVRAGAQDHLFHDELDGATLSRAVRYAVQRKRADLAHGQLTESRLHAQENARLERGLLPTPLLSGSDLRFAARYRPGRSRTLLGGDFYDTVRTPDGTVHAMIGDVCGHGPDEAALGVELRIAWRALTFAGLWGEDLLRTLQQVLEHERADEEIFATLCTVDIAPDGREAGLCLAGHPAPLLARAGQDPHLLPYDDPGPALGWLPDARWPRRRIALGESWSLMMYTDGLIEGRVGDGTQRLGQDGMTAMMTRLMSDGLRGEDLLDTAVREVRDLNGGELTDDLAVLLLDRGDGRG